MKLLKTDVKAKNHFSFVLQKNRIIGIGQNHPYKTHPFADRHGYRHSCIHSELDAYLDLPREIDYKKLKLINVRLSGKSIKAKMPILRMAKPCVCCGKWINSVGFKEIWYSFDGRWEKYA
jgi:deoxycytidylate deaminase